MSPAARSRSHVVAASTIVQRWCSSCGATTASLPYLVQVNARGLMVIDTEDYGLVACIPLGMSEVSTITFDTSMTENTPVSKGDEMGMFQYGGSSFVMVFQKLPGKRLFFQSASGLIYEKQPVLPKGSSGSGVNVTWIGSQIGKWQDVDFVVESTPSWQNSGYVNTGKQYAISYVGGVWTANPEINDGNLYGPAGSSVTAHGPSYPMGGQAEGALVAKVGDNPPFLVGAGPVTTPAGQTGPLQFVINDDLTGEFGALHLRRAQPRRFFEVADELDNRPVDLQVRVSPLPNGNRTVLAPTSPRSG